MSTCHIECRYTARSILGNMFSNVKTHVPLFARDYLLFYCKVQHLTQFLLFLVSALLFQMLYNKVFATLDKKESPKKGKPRVSSSQDNQKNIMDLVNGSMMEDKEMDNTGDDDGWTEVKSKARGKRYSGT